MVCESQIVTIAKTNKQVFAKVYEFLHQRGNFYFCVGCTMWNSHGIIYTRTVDSFEAVVNDSVVDALYEYLLSYYPRRTRGPDTPVCNPGIGHHTPSQPGL